MGDWEREKGGGGVRVFFLSGGGGGGGRWERLGEGEGGVQDCKFVGGGGTCVDAGEEQGCSEICNALLK